MVTAPSPSPRWTGSLLRLGGGQVLLAGPALSDVVRALETARHVTRNDGYGPNPHWTTLLEQLRAALDECAVTSPAGSGELPEFTERAVSPVEPITSAEAGRLLGCTARNVRDLAARGVLTSGRQVAGRLQFERSEIEGERLRRQERRAA